MPRKTLYERYEIWFKRETQQAFWVHLAVFLFSFVMWALPNWVFKVGGVLVFLFTGYRLLMLIKRRMRL